jgi:hypothetical protein
LIPLHHRIAKAGRLALVSIVHVSIDYIIDECNAWSLFFRSRFFFFLINYFIMDTNPPLIPLRITQLMFGFFMQTLDNKGIEDLEEWVNDCPENELAFENCCDIVQRPFQPDHDDKEQQLLIHVATLLTKKFNNTITPEETKFLDSWIFQSAINPAIFDCNPSLVDMHTNYRNLLLRTQLICFKVRGN